MNKDKRSDVQDAGRGLVLDTVLSVGSEAVGEIIVLVTGTLL